jgi:hypothetical protein
MIEPTALPPAAHGSVSIPKRQTRSAASAYLDESTTSIAQMSTAHRIQKLSFVARWSQRLAVPFLVLEV